MVDVILKLEQTPEHCKICTRNVQSLHLKIHCGRTKEKKAKARHSEAGGRQQVRGLTPSPYKKMNKQKEYLFKIKILHSIPKIHKFMFYRIT